MKQISGFSVIGINNGYRLSYVHDKIGDNGELIAQNVVKSFYLVDEDLKSHAPAIFSALAQKENPQEANNE